jgi:L-iditol 2-dehydrogenase
MEATRVCWPEAGRAVLETFTLREPGPGEVAVETEVTLISPGTERATFLGLPNTPGRFPSYPGYSSVGRVTALGEGVTALAAGDRVVSWAGHASHAVTSAARCWKLPEELPLEEAVYCSLAGIGLQAVRKARVELGEAVLVVGLGLVGNLALQLARLQGGLPAIGLDLEHTRCETAIACGADACFDPRDPGTAAAIDAATEGRGPAVVIEATGSPEPVNEALALAGNGARVVLLASTRGVTETNFYRDVHRKGLTILGAHNAARPPQDSSPGFWTLDDDSRCVLRLMLAGRLHLRPLTSQFIPWQEAPHAYEQLATWGKEALGVVIRWAPGRGG